MLRNFAVAVLLIGFASIATPAVASESSTTLIFSAYDKYLYQDFDLVATDKWVSQNEIDYSGGNHTFGLWASTELSGNGKWGHRGGGDEIDLEYFYNSGLPTPIGNMQYSLSASYYMIALKGEGNGIDHARDDIVALYAEGSREFGLGGAVTVAPYLRVSEYYGIDTLPSATQSRLGSRLHVTLGRLWSASVDAAWVHDYSAPGDGDRPNHFRSSTCLTFGRKVALSLELRTSDSDRMAGAKLVVGL